MRTSSTSEASHAAASRLAARGADAIQHMQAIVDLAKQMLASRQSEPVQNDAACTGPEEPDGSAAETLQPPSKPRVFLGTVSELVQGQGHTLHFAAGLARRESEFRSQLARDWGSVLAKGAHIQSGLSTFPFADLMMAKSGSQSARAIGKRHRCSGLAALYLSLTWGLLTGHAAG